MIANISQATLERIASMVLHEMSVETIARVAGLSVGELNEVMEGEGFKGEFAKKAEEEYSNQQLINNGWESVEAMGVGQVINFMKNSRDPEFALKAAMLANKAVRRTGSKQQAINMPSVAGASVIVQLPTVFLQQVNVQGNGVQTVEHVQATGNVSTLLDMSQRKVTDMMPIKQVTAMLTARKSEKEQIEEMMAHV